MTKAPLSNPPSPPSERPIGQLIESGVEIQADGYVLQRWENGQLFVQTPNGEGTVISEEALAEALQQLFEENF